MSRVITILVELSIVVVLGTFIISQGLKLDVRDTHGNITNHQKDILESGW